MEDTREALREIDLATAPGFLVAIREMVDWADERAVVIDCSGITFMDSSAFHALREAHDYAIEHDHLLVIRGLGEQCARVVSVCDARNELTIDGSSDSELVRQFGRVGQFGPSSASSSYDASTGSNSSRYNSNSSPFLVATST